MKSEKKLKNINLDNNLEKKLTVYYDGLCHLCSREIEHYKNQAGSEQILFMDICQSDFDAQREGLDPFKVHRVMHVRKSDGSLATGVQAFVEIWQVLPKYGLLAKLARNRAVRQTLEIGYSAFATVRPWLPRKKAQPACQDSPFCELKNG